MADGQNIVAVEGVFTPTDHRVKDHEKEMVFRIIQGASSVSQKQILGSYHIRPADLSNAIKDLLEDGLIQRDPASENRSRGRPEIFFQARNSRLVSMAVYTDSWNFRAVTIDLGGNIINEYRCPASPKQSAGELQKMQMDLIRQLMKDLPPKTEILGAGISLPGNVDTEKSVWKESQRWINVRNMDYRSLEDELKLPVVIYRDLDAALLRELMLSPGLKDELVVLLHWGVGLGLSFAYRGTIIRSNHGRFGTIGYTQFDPRKKDHVYAGDLEKQTSLRELIKALRKKYPRISLDEREIAILVQGDDFNDIPEFKNAVDYVGLALRNICAIFYPDRIFLLSPFTENPKILKRIKTAFSSGHFIDNLQEKIPLAPVADGYRGCIFGSTQVLFENGLKKYLKARY